MVARRAQTGVTYLRDDYYREAAFYYIMVVSSMVLLYNIATS
jgi:hypothetical protein